MSGGNRGQRGSGGRGGGRGRGSNTSSSSSSTTNNINTARAPGKPNALDALAGGLGFKRGAGRGTANANGPAARGGRANAGGPRNSNGNSNARKAPVASESNFVSSDPMNSTPFRREQYVERFKYLQKEQPRIKAELIQRGLEDRDGPIYLHERVNKYGLSTAMCPEYERVRRIVENNVKAPECTKETETAGHNDRVPDESRMVKAYHRSAAGEDNPLMTEVRTPATLLKTMKYMVHRHDEDSFHFLNGWMWDRSRAVRKDFSSTDRKRGDVPIYVECLEICIRFHLVSMHQMAKGKSMDYSHANHEQQLIASYAALFAQWAASNVTQPHHLQFAKNAPPPPRSQLEDKHIVEFLCYRIILGVSWDSLSISDHYEHIRRHPSIQTALEIAQVADVARTSNGNMENFAKFWNLIESSKVSYLMACAAAVSFNEIRAHTLATIRRAYRVPNNTDWTPEKLVAILGFDDRTQVIDFISAYKAKFEISPEGIEYLDLNTVSMLPAKDLKSLKEKQFFSQRFVESKLNRRKFSAVLLGLNCSDAQKQGLMNTRYNDEEDSLFIPELSSKPKPFAATSLPGSTNKPNPFAAAALAAKSSPSSLGVTPPTVQPGLFDASKNNIKFASPTHGGLLATSAPSPFANAATAFAMDGQSFVPTAPKTSFSFQASPSPQTTTATQGEERRQAEAQRKLAEEAQRKTHEEAQRKAQQEQQRAAEEQQRRIQLEQEKRAREAEKQRLFQEDQERQQRLRVQAQQRMARVEQERLAREEHLRAEQEVARRKEEARAKALGGLAENLLMDPRNGLMQQKIEYMIEDMIKDVKASLEAEQQEKNDRLADSMYQQKRLASIRAMVFKWVRFVDKKKRKSDARQRRQRRQKWKNHAQHLPVETTTPSEIKAISDGTIHRPVDNRTNGASRAMAKPTSHTSVHGEAELVRLPNNTSIVQTSKKAFKEAGTLPRGHEQGVTHTSVNGTIAHNSTLNAGYSEAYYKSRADSENHHKSQEPIDRTETDWFKLRAMGVDPSKHRKRSFGSVSSDKEEVPPGVEHKRARRSTSSALRHSLPPPSTDEERMARFRAIKQGHKKASSVSRPFDGTRTFNGRSSLIIAQARELIAETPQLQHSPPGSVLGGSICAPGSDERPAYWARQSRFVPQHLYGKGPEAVLAYREKIHGRSSMDNQPAKLSSRFSAKQELSSPIPTQLSYRPSGHTQRPDEDGYEHATEDEADCEEDEVDEEGEEDGMDYDESGEEEQFYAQDDFYDEEEEEEMEDGPLEQFAQHPGATQDDAIELSD